MAGGDASQAKKRKHVANKKRQSSNDKVNDILDFNLIHFKTFSEANR